jgi:hypothetical protein
MSTRKISQLPAATVVAGPDLVPIVQGGETKRATVSLLAVAGPTGPAGDSIVGPTGPAGAGEAYQGATAPAEASAGATWLDTSSGKYFVRYDDLWIEVGFQESFP